MPGLGLNNNHLTFADAYFGASCVSVATEITIIVQMPKGILAEDLECFAVTKGDLGPSEKKAKQLKNGWRLYRVKAMTDSTSSKVAKIYLAGSGLLGQLAIRSKNSSQPNFDHGAFSIYEAVQNGKVVEITTDPHVHGPGRKLRIHDPWRVINSSVE
jgi:hypothetical protein